MAYTGSRPYRRALAKARLRSDLCVICGHPGATTGEHVIPKSLGGSDTEENIGLAHGTMGPYQPANPCPTCGKLCNQARGNGTRRPDTQQHVTYRSREW